MSLDSMHNALMGKGISTPLNPNPTNYASGRTRLSALFKAPVISSISTNGVDITTVVDDYNANKPEHEVPDAAEMISVQDVPDTPEDGEEPEEQSTPEPPKPKSESVLRPAKPRRAVPAMDPERYQQLVATTTAEPEVPSVTITHRDGGKEVVKLEETIVKTDVGDTLVTQEDDAPKEVVPSAPVSPEPEPQAETESVQTETDVMAPLAPPGVEIVTWEIKQARQATKQPPTVNIHNRTVAKFATIYLQNYAPPETIQFNGTIIRNTGDAGIWEESSYHAQGNDYVFFAATSAGGYLDPVVINNLAGQHYGRHALVPVHEGDLVVIGVTLNGEPTDNVVAYYRITKIVDADDADHRFVRITAELVGYNNSDVKSIKDHPWLGDKAFARLGGESYDLPIHTAPYRENFLDMKDYADCIHDYNFAEELITAPSLEHLYDEAGKVLGRAIYAGNMDRRTRPLLIVSVNYYEQQDICVVFVMGVLYSMDEHSSRSGRLFYGRVVLREDLYLPFTAKTCDDPHCAAQWSGDPDAGTVLPLEQVPEFLKNRHGSFVQAFRRLTPAK